MTPKEKAEKLVDKFIPHTRIFHEVLGWEDYIDSAKQCALICVDELIIISNWGGIIDGDIEENSKEYFMQVNQEIQLLNKQD